MEVLIVAKCNVNYGGSVNTRCTFSVLIVAKCNVNSDSIQTEFLFKGKYLQFESNVN